jgi:beta-lactamase class A
MIDQLADEIRRIADASGAVVGCGFLHVESGQRLILNEGLGFPMASTYKIAMAARLLSLVDQGETSLDEMVSIDRDDLSPGGGLVTAHIHHPGLSLSVHNLINLAMTVSDNTSTDKMLELAGGADAVNEFLQGKGIHGMRIDRTTKLLITDAYGVTDRLSNGRWSHDFLREIQPTIGKGPGDEAGGRFLTDPRDTTTPEAMVDLLRELLAGTLLSASMTKVLLDIMENCVGGTERLRGFLPPGTTVAHKTGTIPSACMNDAGIIYLPGGGQAIVAVFVRATSVRDFIGVPESDSVIAQIARSAYDFALFSS